MTCKKYKVLREQTEVFLVSNLAALLRHINSLAPFNLTEGQAGSIRAKFETMAASNPEVCMIVS